MVRPQRMVYHSYRPNRKKLYYRRRHLGLIAMDRLQIKQLLSKLKKVLVLISLMENGVIEVEEESSLALRILCGLLYKKYRDIIRSPDELNNPLSRIVSKNRTIEYFEEEDCFRNFRFNKSQLKDLIQYFQMPIKLYSEYRHVFCTEELLLVVLFYLHYPCNTIDLTFKEIFGWDSWKVNLGVKILTNWLLTNWSYLIYDNMKFWLPQFPLFAEKIKGKMASYGYKFPTDADPFVIKGFIDCTVYSSCRPGSGPTTDGVNSPRYHPLIQRSYYNGWKSHHGLKWQTVGLPNGVYGIVLLISFIFFILLVTGMMFHAWGPVSCRHNDNWTLGASEYLLKVGDLQRDCDTKYCDYGDSAYWPDDFLQSKHRGDNLTEEEKLENDLMSKCRQSIEWDYGHSGELWKRVSYMKGLKLRKQPICNIVSLCFLLTNAHVCMNASQTSEYFNCKPPDIEVWTSAGPRAANIVDYFEMDADISSF